MIKAIVICLLLLVGAEAWRLSSPETVRLRQTWAFQTTAGPATASNVIELRQWGAIPYLPGGSVGKSETSGPIPVSVSEAGARYFISSDPRHVIENALRSGQGDPSLSMAGITNAYTTAFVRRLRNAKSEIVVPINGAGSLRPYLALSQKQDNRGGLAGERTKLADFEAAHPGFRLLDIRYRVTDEAVDQ